MKTKKQNPPKGGTLTKEQIKWLNECTTGTWKLNPQTGLVDVDGCFSCYEQGLSDFKGVRFGVVEGGFRCYNNRLTSLVGAPREVKGIFRCDDNQLTSLEGAPEKVGGCFDCSNNLLTSLVGAPEKVDGFFFFDDNPVSEQILDKIFSRIIFSHMKGGESYLKAVESLWAEIPLEDQVLLYRPEFKWVGAEEAKKLQAVGRFNKIKSIL